MSGCEQFKEGTRKRAICEGSAALSLCKINAYREQWGLGPIAEDDPIRQGVIVPKRSNTTREARRRSSGTNLKNRRPHRVERKKHARKTTIPKKGLGDRVEQALTTVGVTSERVSKWLGRPCGCAKRKRKLNQLGAWVTRVLTGKTKNAEQYLEDIIGEE